MSQGSGVGGVLPSVQTQIGQGVSHYYLCTHFGHRPGDRAAVRSLRLLNGCLEVNDCCLDSSPLVLEGLTGT